MYCAGRAGGNRPCRPGILRWVVIQKEPSPLARRCDVIRILIVEDEKPIRNLIRISLKNAGYF